ncbi:MAG: hypothetical protein QM564_03850 [Bergeyella sp.]
MKKLSAFALFLAAIHLHAQALSGEIYIRDNSNYFLNQVFVTNLNEYKTVKADLYGQFRIQAKVGDVIRFTSIITDRKDIKVTQNMLEHDVNFIELNIAYYDIQEVVISKFKPTGNLRKDVLSLKNGEKELALKKAIGLPEPKGDGLPTQLPLASFTNGGLTFGLDSIYDIISGERKKKERLQRYEKMNSAIENIKQYYGGEYFAALKIPENLVDNFLQFVYSSDNLTSYLENSNYNAVAVYIEKYVPIYQRRLRNSYLLEAVK